MQTQHTEGNLKKLGEYVLAQHVFVEYLQPRGGSEKVSVKEKTIHQPSHGQQRMPRPGGTLAKCRSIALAAQTQPTH